MTKRKIKSPKRDVHAEVRLLGALLRVENHHDPIAQEVFSVADEGFFHQQGTKELFLFIKQCYDNKRHFDMVSLLGSIPGDSEAYIALTQTIGDGYFTTNSYKQDLETLGQWKSVRPQLIAMQSIIDGCDNDNVAQSCVDRINDGIMHISKHSLSRNAEYCESYEDIIDEILSSQDGAEPIIRTNLYTWPPFPADAMVTIAGRSGTGKTYLALFLMEHLTQVMPEKQALYFNLEMQKGKLVTRHAAMVAGWKDTQKETVFNAAAQLMSRDVKLITRPGITIDEIELIARTQAMKKPISVIVVDYIGLVRTKSKYERRDLEQGDIAQRLAGLAVELKCVVLTLIQVNREHKGRPAGDKCPVLTDAADSIGCERSSSWWLGIDQPQIDSDEPEYRDMFVVKNRKVREDAGLFTVHMEFKNGIFREIDQTSVRLPMNLKPLKDKFTPFGPKKGEQHD